MSKESGESPRPVSLKRRDRSFRKVGSCSMTRCHRNFRWHLVIEHEPTFLKDLSRRFNDTGLGDSPDSFDIGVLRTGPDLGRPNPCRQAILSEERHYGFDARPGLYNQVAAVQEFVVEHVV